MSAILEKVVAAAAGIAATLASIITNTGVQKVVAAGALLGTWGWFAYTGRTPVEGFISELGIALTGMGVWHVATQKPKADPPVVPPVTTIQSVPAASPPITTDAATPPAPQ